MHFQERGTIKESFDGSNMLSVMPRVSQKQKIVTMLLPMDQLVYPLEMDGKQARGRMIVAP